MRSSQLLTTRKFPHDRFSTELRSAARRRQRRLILFSLSVIIAHECRTVAPHCQRRPWLTAFDRQFASHQLATRLPWTASSREEDVPPLRGLANRVDQATTNFLETFPLFAAVVLLAQITNCEITAWANDRADRENFIGLPSRALHLTPNLNTLSDISRLVMSRYCHMANAHALLVRLNGSI